MENYIVSARKYRPDTFDTVVGQEALTTTLKNAISSNKLAHAYLFCGPRGVGKTTCARIFAKTINCLNKTAEGEACNQCESCQAFNEQRSYNIHELDAASNNTVDDIRQLIEMVRIQPQIGKYRVFIIDEVHMLSTQAFNAFLKTLEEPPAHAIFILATTEKHKLLPTILSRCQIYDFNRISVQDIVNHLAKVAQNENVQAELEALNVIAVKSDGGMRDALSMFDQSASYTRGNLTYQGVLENLNVLDYDYFFKLVDAFLKQNIVDSLLIFNEILNKGFEANAFITGLNSHFRDLLVSKNESTLKLLETGATIKEKYKEQAKHCSTKFIFRAMQLCRNCELNYKQSNNKRLLVELTLIEITQLTEESGDSDRPLGQQKQLKPITKTSSTPTNTASTASQQYDNVSSTKSVAREDNVNYKKSSSTNDGQKNKVSEKPVESPTTTQQGNSQGNSMIEQLKNTGTGRKIPKVLKNDLGVSIKKIKMKLNESDQSQSSGTNSINGVVAKKQNTTPFDDGELNYQWQTFINKMPIDQKALAVRMRAMRIKLLPDTFKFDVVVDNELVANEFNAVKRDLEVFLRQALKNDFVEMVVSIATPSENNNRAFSKVEKYQLMSSKNTALNELKETFGLEFY